MKLIITRPIDDALKLAKNLEGRGHAAIIAPLLKIVARRDVSLPDKRYQTVCITSANALVNPDLLAKLRDLPLFCVGPQSAIAALRAGFSNVQQRGPDVLGLANGVSDELAPGNGPILYLSGEATSGDLEGRLATLGFAVDRVVAYDAIPLPLNISASDWADADGVLLYSPRSAKLWVEAVGAARPARPAELVHFCLSSNVAHALPSSWPSRVAAKPDEDHMLSMLDQPGEAE